MSACAFALLAACASEPQGGHGAYGGDARRGESGRAGLNLFISPAGEPFHGAAGAPYASASWFAGADTNHDGRLTRDEFRADAERFFHVLDTDHDGVIDGFEVQAYEQTVAPEILPRLEGLREGEGMNPALARGGGGGAPAAANRRVQAGDTRPEGAALYSMLNEPEPVAAADTDFTGRISLGEWLAKTDGRFALLDVHGSGYLTLDTLPKTAAQEVLDRLRKRDAKRTPHPSSR